MAEKQMNSCCDKENLQPVPNTSLIQCLSCKRIFREEIQESPFDY